MTLDEFIKRVDEGFAGKPMPHTAKPLGLKKIKKGGKTYYVPINSDPRRGEGNKVMDNFADGKKPGRKGISKRVGIPKGATMAQLQKYAKAGGEKGRMARWQLNMRRGKKKSK
jgi:hypothetical protein|tara:strand:- start:100 stop:438 length:339 start_codon:yes stop_codon:yes gene_type:complete